MLAGSSLSFLADSPDSWESDTGDKIALPPNQISSLGDKGRSCCYLRGFSVNLPVLVSQIGTVLMLGIEIMHNESLSSKNVFYWRRTDGVEVQ